MEVGRSGLYTILFLQHILRNKEGGIIPKMLSSFFKVVTSLFSCQAFKFLISRVHTWVIWREQWEVTLWESLGRKNKEQKAQTWLN